MIRSALLRAQLLEALGAPESLDAVLQSADSAAPGLLRALQLVDATYARFGGLQQATVEVGGLVVSEWDMQSGRIDSGKAWKSLLGYAPDELSDTVAALRALVQPDDLPLLSEAIATHVREASRSFAIDCRCRTRTGHWRWLRISGRVLARDANGEPTRLVVLQQDVDAARHMEDSLRQARMAAETAGRSRTAFLANMSHEIRTPMNAILGMTELALDTALDDEQRHYLSTVRSSCEALLAIVNDILDFSKIEAGKLQVERIDFELSSVVFEAVRTLAVSAQQKGLDIAVDMEPTLPARLWGDPLRLRQVLTNLVGNAIKFTSAGSVTVAVRPETVSGDEVLLRVEVRDTGIGIPADKIGQLFQAFSQADVSTTRRFGGTGLGLAISARLVELMGGKLGVVSEEGKGSTFGFALSLGVRQGAAAVPDLPGVLSGQCVLLIGNPDATQAGLARTFDRWGVPVEPVATMAAARALSDKRRAAGQPFPLAVVDAAIALEEDGAALGAWLTQAGHEAVISLVTVAGQRDQLPKLKALGVTVHLVKPVAEADLLDAVRLAVGSPSGVFQLDNFDVEASLHAAEAARAGGGLQVLLVEDNLVNQELALHLLEKAGYRVSVAANGEEAIECFEREHFDVILMDMQMPVMDGLEATQAIRARELRRSWVSSVDGFKQIPIVAMTANAMEGDRDRCLQAGMNDYIAKPIRQADLLEVIQRVTSGDAAPITATAKRGGGGYVSIDPEAAARDIGDTDVVRQMARMLLQQWDSHVTGISGALAKKDGPTLCRAAHTFKGLLAMFHAEEARRHALAIEQAAKEERWSVAAAEEMSLRLALETARQELQAFVGA